MKEYNDVTTLRRKLQNSICVYDLIVYCIPTTDGLKSRSWSFSLLVFGPTLADVIITKLVLMETVFNILFNYSSRIILLVWLSNWYQLSNWYLIAK